MPQSLSKVGIHLVFSTKNRHPFLQEEIRKDVFAYLAGILRSEGHQCISVGGHDDHVHLLFAISRVHSLADTVKTIKTSSSKWMKLKGNQYEDFSWQLGYGAFGISSIDTDSVVNYIANQDEHHQTLSFQDEFRAFLVEFDVESDERYVWD